MVGDKKYQILATEGSSPLIFKLSSLVISLIICYSVFALRQFSRNCPEAWLLLSFS